MARIINDGRNKKDSWKDGEASGYPLIEIVYRPALYKRVTAVLESRRDIDKRAEVTIDLLVDHLVSWNVTEANPANEKEERLVPITKDSVAGCPPPMIDWMFEKVAGYTAGRVAEEKN